MGLNNIVVLPPGGGMKKTQRKSKTDALAVINGAAQAAQRAATAAPSDTSTTANSKTSVDGGDANKHGPRDPANNPCRKAMHTPLGLPIPLDNTPSPAPPVSLNGNGRIASPPAPAPTPPLVSAAAATTSSTSYSTPSIIPTSRSTPRHPPPRTQPRLFELEEAPTFYPTREEFADPLKYIQWVGDAGKGKDYGIVKIVPPEGWDLDFVVDQATFRFHTRVQRLNSLSATARAAQNYLDQLQKFHAQQGRPRLSIPIIDRRPVDLYALKRRVEEFGGWDAVCKHRRWSEVGRRMGYEEFHPNGAGAQVKNAYFKIILPFERYLLRAKAQSVSPSATFSGLGSASVSPSRNVGPAGLVPGAPQDTPSRGASSSAASVDNKSLVVLGSPADSPSEEVRDASDALRRAVSTHGRSTPTPNPGADATPTPAGSPAPALATFLAGAASNNIEDSPGSGTGARRRSARHKPNSSPHPSSLSSSAAAKSASSQSYARTAAVAASPLGRAFVGVSAPPQSEDHVSRAHLLDNAEGAEEQMCELCLRGEDGLSMLLCDGCNRGYHLYCLDPPLPSIPKSQWYCPACLVETGNDYGFDEGEEHTLHSFWRRADEFRSKWWEARRDQLKSSLSSSHSSSSSVSGANVASQAEGSAKGVPNGVVRTVAKGIEVSEDEVEREFWRLVESKDETVEVEYGADVHSTTHGSASPTLETNPLNPYSKDGWNLNNFPILPGSLLRYIKSDISGMTVPWIYVGMMFSTFCWHNEDHYTYSINYQHWGDTKTWYGIPGEDAEKFEQAMRKAAPDLFETSPDLLFQLVTMMSPKRLKDEGVRVFAVDQRPNEFVITFPKAYHSGFNHGFNFNEAVNFALPDWIPYGVDCVRRYQQHNKLPVFSHDELLITVSQHNQTISTAMWLQHCLQEMVGTELEKRNRLRAMAKQLRELHEDYDRPEAEYQCNVCSAFCYLSQVVCDCADRVACLNHAERLCACDMPNKTLRVHFSDEHLLNLAAKIAERAAVPSAWQFRLRRLLVNNQRPPLRSLRGLLHEGEKIAFPLPEISQLRTFVERANEWVETAMGFIARKHHNRRAEAPRGGGGGGGRGRKALAEDYDADRTPSRTEGGGDGSEEAVRRPEMVRQLLKEVETLPFDAPEIQSLRDVAEKMKDFKLRAKAVLSNPDALLAECEQVHHLGSTLSVELEEMNQLKKLVARHKFFAEMEEIHANFLNLDEVRELLDEAKRSDVPDDDRFVVDLRRRLALGLDWEKKATAAFDAEGPIDVVALSDLIKAPVDVPIVPALHLRAEHLVEKEREWAKAASNLFQTSDKVLEKAVTAAVDVDVDDYPKVAEARRLLKTADSLRIQPKGWQELREAVHVYKSWKRQMEEVMKWPADRAYSANEKKKHVDRWVSDVLAMTDEADDLPPFAGESRLGGPRRYCVCRTLEKPTPEWIECDICKELYHTSCLGLPPRAAKVKRHFFCPICDLSKLRDLHRNPYSLSAVLKLIERPEYQLDKFRFPPVEYFPIRQAALSAKRAERAMTESVNAILPSIRSDSKAHIEHLRHCLRKIMMAPVRTCLVSEPEENDLYDCIVRVLQEHAPGPVLAKPSQGGGEGEGEGGGGGGQVAPSRGDRETEKKRKRAKRAKLVFKEEVDMTPSAEGQQQRIYCLCRQSDTGDMVQCDRCELWYHSQCCHVGDDFATLSNNTSDKWLCPICCVKRELRYPYAEVKVRDKDVTSGDMYLDVRATLRSETGPKSKPQEWTSDKRIELHLHAFQPAIPADVHLNGEPVVKRIKLTHGVPASPAGGVDTDSVRSTPAVGSAPNSPKQATTSRAPLPGVSASPLAAGPLVALPSAPTSMAAAPAPYPSTILEQHAEPMHRPPELTMPDRHAQYHPPAARAVPVPVSAPASAPRPNSKPQREEDEQAARHRAGMANLYSRGVTDEMIQRWYIGWNGKSLVYPQYDEHGNFYELDLGPRIQLAPDDVDGSRFIESRIRQAHAIGSQTFVKRDAPAVESRCSLPATQNAQRSPSSQPIRLPPPPPTSASMPSLPPPRSPPPHIRQQWPPPPHLHSGARDQLLRSGLPPLGVDPWIDEIRYVTRRLAKEASDEEIERMVLAYVMERPAPPPMSAPPPPAGGGPPPPGLPPTLPAPYHRQSVERPPPLPPHPYELSRTHHHHHHHHHQQHPSQRPPPPTNTPPPGWATRHPMYVNQPPPNPPR